ncbi:MAG TPA: MerR family DNA-binding transcriptional regulator [Candidatus Paceibacterota bacterium]|nr:MerR family DNA-binding transcriptional regulator [Candidatus Paceibacterota bacterium]
MPKTFLTVSEVARLLGVTPLTIRNWDEKGRLVAYRHPMNNYRMYKVDDVETLLKEIEESKGKRPERKSLDPTTRKLEIEE